MRGRKKGRERWDGRGTKEENERNEKAKVWSMARRSKPCVFNDSIKTKIRARIPCARVRRESGPESADFTSYRAVIVVRKAESFELQEVGAIAAENRGLNETDRPRYAASFHLSVHSVNDDARLPRIFANRDTRNVPLDGVKGRANIWNKSTRRRGKD